jgi:uncharacterized protein DUF6298
MSKISTISSLRILLCVSLVGFSSCSPHSSPTRTGIAPTSGIIGPPTADTPAASATPDKILGPLFVNPDNSRYFTNGVKVNNKYRSIYLTGAHTWCNFMDCGNTNPPVAFDYDAYLDFLQANNLNFFRLWRAENARGGESNPDFWFDPLPYQRSEECCAFDGGNKFDLEKFNQAYFDRMRNRVVEAGERGLYVSIMLFDGWSVESKFGGHNPWVGHPYRLENNINDINGDVNGNGQGEDTHILTNTPVTALQEAYVKKVIDTVNDLDNVLYEISNESPGDNPATPQMDGSRDWQYHMIRFVKEYEATKPKQHPVGITWEWLNGNNQYLYDSPADWISLGGGVNIETYEPPVSDGKSNSKIIIADTDHLCGLCGTIQWIWKSFTRGENLLYMDPYDAAFTGRGAPADYDPNNAHDVSLLLNLGYTRRYANRMNLTATAPLPKMCSTGYCLVNASADGAEYLVFLPSGATVAGILSHWDINKTPLIPLPADSKVNVDLTSSPIELAVEWFNPANGDIIVGTAVQGGSSQSFTAPFSGDAVLYIYDPNP